MGSAIVARKLIKDLLNTNILDPYPGTRKGNSPKQFYDQSDGLNLTRADSFPKGYITSDSKDTILQGIGSLGHANKSVTINIWYFVKDKISYTDGDNIVYKEEDYVEYMVEKIRTYLESNRKINDEYHIKSFDSSNGTQKTQEGTFSVYYDVVPVTIYWDDTYGA